jgi:hypothetical protein
MYLYYLFILQNWGLNSGPTPWATSPGLLFVTGFWRHCHSNYLPGLALNHDPPDLCLLNSWDDRRQPPEPSHLVPI